MQLDWDQAPRGGERVFHVPDRIPLFPLPNVVFFPKTYLPLHIFEPRYREMVSDVAAGGQCVGMVLLKEGWEQDYYGNPPIFDIGCVGRLVSVQGLPDGRSNILLQGLHRFEIIEQDYERSYRRGRIALTPRDGAGIMDPRTRAELVRLVGDYLGTTGDGGVRQDWFRPDIGDEVLVNNLATSLDVTPLEKQFLLEAADVPQRARRLSDLIQFKVCERDGAKGWG